MSFEMGIRYSERLIQQSFSPYKSFQVITGNMAYASVASLMRTMESVLASKSAMESLICHHKEEFCALHEKVSSLEVLLKNFEKNNCSGEMTDLDAQITKVANVVEHIIQLRVTEVVMENDEMLRGKAHEKFSDSLQQAGEDIDRVWRELTKIQDKGKQLVQDFSSTTKDILNVENNMVGRDDERKRLLEDLTRDYSSEPKVIPIIGMGGIGKTTLVREVYNDVSDISHFDVLAWATVCQRHNVKNILLSLLHSTVKMDDMVKMKGEADLRDMLQKSLKGKRYLIVLDDIWSSDVWDDVRLCFPSEENNAGSRILLTTRNNEVACYAGTENLSLQMGFMDRDDSWNLFESIAFFNEALPCEFETIGKQIVDKCHGLPLTIVVVAGLLKSKRTIEYWENVAKDVKTITNDPYKQCLDVLGLSYNHLTSDLKACLLYIGIFPEDSEISVKRLVRLWMAEGFLNLEKDLEGEAEKCLQELVDRCLVLVSEKSLDETKIRSCKVHDLIYDLCLREVQKGNVFLMNNIVFEESDAIKAQRRIRALLTPEHHQSTDDDINNLVKRTRSLFFGDYLGTYILESELIHFKLLKVLDLSRTMMGSFPVQILSLIWLRYLSLFSYQNLDIPPDICRLWNLQTFIIKVPKTIDTLCVPFPEQIWGLMQLRHLKMSRFFMPNRSSGSVGRETYMGFENIQTISYLSPHCCTKEVISGIQNVKKLGISGRARGNESFWGSDGLFNNLVQLHQLESLSLKCSWFSGISPATIPNAKAFPATLKKLKLEGTELSWSELDIIAELPNLEVLKLMYKSCYGEKWVPNVRGFTRLKILLIEYNYDLKYWKATDDNFPFLERLVIRNYHNLKKIPIEFADIDSLQMIELKDCTPELEASAALIQQAQEEGLGKNPVDVRIITYRQR